MNRYPDDVRARAIELCAEGLTQRQITERLREEFGKSPREETVRTWLVAARTARESAPEIGEPAEPRGAGSGQDIGRLYNRANRAMLRIAVDRLRILQQGAKTAQTARQLKEIQAIIEKCEARDARLRQTASAGTNAPNRGDQSDATGGNTGGDTGLGEGGGEGVLTGEQRLRRLREAILGLEEPLRDGILAGLQRLVDIRRAEALS